MNIFLTALVIELPNNISINKYNIKLIKRKQSSNKSIYAFSPVKLEILKVYIKVSLKTRFIQPFKTLVYTFILLNKKLDSWKLSRSKYLHNQVLVSSNSN